MNFERKILKHSWDLNVSEFTEWKYLSLHILGCQYPTQGTKKRKKEAFSDYPNASIWASLLELEIVFIRLLDVFSQREVLLSPILSLCLKWTSENGIVAGQKQGLSLPCV